MRDLLTIAAGKMIYLMRLMDVARCCFGLQVPFKVRDNMFVLFFRALRTSFTGFSVGVQILEIVCIF